MPKITTLLLGAFLLASLSASAQTTYHIDWVGGSDFNSGTSTSAPWKRHPYMKGFSGFYFHQAGDRFIFKGGVTWPNEAFPMAITAGGDVGKEDYYGVDEEWFSGAAWTRPVFDLEHRGIGDGKEFIINIDRRDNIILDNFEIRKQLIVSGLEFDRGAIRNFGNKNITVRNCFIHSWRIDNKSTANDTRFGGIIFRNPGPPVLPVSPGSVVENCIIDGSLDGGDSGFGIWGPETARGNIIHDIPNGILSTRIIHDNHIYNIRDSFDPDNHENAIETFVPATVFNNLIHDVEKGVCVFLTPAENGGGMDLFYNNVIYNSFPIPVQIDTDWTTGDGPINEVGARIFNNTMVCSNNSGCVRVVDRGVGPLDVVEVTNNHFIANVADATIISTAVVLNLVESFNILMEEAVAGAAGYTAGNKYAPISGDKATVESGRDLSGVFNADILGFPRPQGPLWDVGAYEFIFNRPDPPKNLRVVVP